MSICGLFPTKSEEDLLFDWNSDELERATTYIMQNNLHLDDPEGWDNCKAYSAPIPTPNSKVIDTDTLPESMWDKFDICDYVLDSNRMSPLLVGDEELEKELQMAAQQPEERFSCSLDSNPSMSELRHHDCMWAGLCRHEEHGDADALVTPPSSPTFDIRPVSPTVTVPLLKSSTTTLSSSPLPRPTNSRSLLVPRKDIARMAATKSQYHELVGHRPETPVSDFDESFNTIQNVCDSGNEEEDSETESNQSSSEENDDLLEETSVMDQRYVNHGTSYITDHTYGRPFRQPDTSDLGLCTPSDSEEEIDVVSLQPSSLLETTVIEEDQQLLCSPSKRAKLTPTKRSARQSARAARASTLASQRSSQSSASHDFQEELQQSLAAVAAEAAKEVVAPLRMRLQQHGAKRRKSSLPTPSSSSSGNSSDSSSGEETPPMPTKRGPKRSRLSKQLKAASRKRSSAAMSSSGRSSSDSEDRSGKRTMHNTMERQRRVDLRNAFEQLRKYIPPLLNSEKAPKVTILREASTFCLELQKEEARIERQRAALLKEQAALKQRLAQARRSSASARR